MDKMIVTPGNVSKEHHKVGGWTERHSKQEERRRRRIWNEMKRQQQRISFPYFTRNVRVRLTLWQKCGKLYQLNWNVVLSHVYIIYKLSHEERVDARQKKSKFDKTST